jgi:hypothetical protein
MKLSLVADALRAELDELGDLGGGPVAEAAGRLAPVLVRATTSLVLGLLSEAAAQISADVPDGDVELRLAGDDLSFAYVAEPSPAAGSEGEPSARITLRLSEDLKQRVEARAAAEGLSVNTWVLRQLERRSRPSSGSFGRSRLHGYGTS